MSEVGVNFDILPPQVSCWFKLYIQDEDTPKFKIPKEIKKNIK